MLAAAWGRHRRTTKATQAMRTGAVKATHGATGAKQALRIGATSGTHGTMQHGQVLRRTRRMLAAVWGRRRRTTKATHATRAGAVKATHGATGAQQALRIGATCGTHGTMQHGQVLRKSRSTRGPMQRGGKHQRTPNVGRGQRLKMSKTGQRQTLLRQLRKGKRQLF